MLEMILNPRRGQRRPWEMLIVGLVYGSLSVLLVNWIFAPDPVLAKYSGILIVTFSVMFTLPFVYYTIRLEEEKDSTIESSMRLLHEHSRAIHVFLWLFLGLIVAFSFWYIILDNTDNYRAQVETYCLINSPENFEGCISQYGVSNKKTTGFATSMQWFGGVLTNNIYVLIFTIVFSIIFGAGGMFILSWNASVIAAAMVIFAQSSVSKIPLSLARFMIHGTPEIASYFVGTLAGGIIGMSIIKKEYKTDKFWDILHDSLLLIVIAIVLLVVAGLIEVFVTPQLISLV